MFSPHVINLKEKFEKLILLENRTPHSKDEEKKGSFANLSTYQDGAIYIGYFNGLSDWERHNSGDEVVMIIEGETNLVILGEDKKENSFKLKSGEFLVVPKSSWHRFETFGPIKLVTFTPMPTDHSIEIPLN